MKKKYFYPTYRTLIFLLIFTISFLIGVTWLIFCFINLWYNLLTFCFLLIAISLVFLLLSINPTFWILIDYSNREITTSFKMNKNDRICVPFDDLIDFEIILSEEIKRRFNVSKCPKCALLIRSCYKDRYISLALFTNSQKNNILQSMKELLIK